MAPKRGQRKEVIVRLTEPEAEALEQILYGKPQPASTLFHRVSRARARVTAKYREYRQAPVQPMRRVLSDEDATHRRPSADAEDAAIANAKAEGR